MDGAAPVGCMDRPCTTLRVAHTAHGSDDCGVKRRTAVFSAPFLRLVEGRQGWPMGAVRTGCSQIAKGYFGPFGDHPATEQGGDTVSPPPSGAPWAATLQLFAGSARLSDNAQAARGLVNEVQLAPAVLGLESKTAEPPPDKSGGGSLFPCFLSVAKGGIRLTRCDVPTEF